MAIGTSVSYSTTAVEKWHTHLNTPGRKRLLQGTHCTEKTTTFRGEGTHCTEKTATFRGEGTHYTEKMATLTGEGTHCTEKIVTFRGEGTHCTEKTATLRGEGEVLAKVSVVYTIMEAMYPWQQIIFINQFDIKRGLFSLKLNSKLIFLILYCKIMYYTLILTLKRSISP